ncbi:MAG: hypothetical protein EPN86_04940 [Nanoarchaeota archaeon]|nr:MAG: hypothetical protein EPN86_04940 [Nanoarchaeota archaeon]
MAHQNSDCSVNIIQACPNGCSNGACLNPPPKQCNPSTTPPRQVPCGLMCGAKTVFCNSQGNFDETSCQNEGVCVPGAEDTSACSLGGSRTCSSSCQWNSCQSTGVCIPGTLDAQPCGNKCGLKFRVCGSNFQWNEFGVCTGEGICTPGQTDQMFCGINGVKVRSCNNACMWSSFGVCQESAECSPGQIDQRSCGNCGVQLRICQSNGMYTGFGQCTGQGVCSPGSTQVISCGVSGTQILTCTNFCRWNSGTCQETGVCIPGQVDTKACGLCGTSSRVCQSNGQWGMFNACMNQGVCNPGTSQSVSCGINGTSSRTCSNSCQWTSFGACEEPNNVRCSPGQVQTEQCGSSGLGICGKGSTSRVCQSNFNWGSWGACTGNLEPRREICNGLDDNCDGRVDEGTTCENLIVKSVQVLNGDCVNPGDDLATKVVLENDGHIDYKAMKIAVSSDVLDLYAVSDTFSLNDNKDISFIVNANIPPDTNAGRYDLRITAGNGVEVNRVIYRDFIVSPASCRVTCDNGSCR